MRYAAAAVAVALLGSVPASAAETTVAYNDGSHGSISVFVGPETSTRATADASATGAECHYDVVAGSSATGTMTVAVAGHVVSGTRVIVDRDRPEPSVPVGTVITCTVMAADVVHDATRTLLGPSSAVADLVDLPVAALTVCVTAHVVYSNGSYVTIDRHCRGAEPVLG